jgi:hypothetical protein
MIDPTLPLVKKTLTLTLIVVGAFGNLALPGQATPVEVKTLSTTAGDLGGTLKPPQPFSFKLAQSQPTPKDRGAPLPGNQVGGGSRGSCLASTKRLTALIPVLQSTPNQSRHPALERIAPGSIVGLSTASHPTFWVYLPYSLPPEGKIEFVLKDDQDKIIYETNLSKSGAAPGVVGFQLPETVPALKENGRYKWFVSVYCNTDDGLDDPAGAIYVSGWVERVALDPSLKRQLAQATPDQKSRLYAQADIWYEAVTELAELRRQNPNDATLKAQWDELLQSIGLEGIAAEPIRSMLTAQK